MRAVVAVDHPDGLGVDVAFEVTRGETVALVGPNGAGKTTTVLALAGLIDGATVEDAGSIGVVFQDGLLFPHMSVAANVAFGTEDDTSPLLSALGIGHLADKMPSTLSGGEAQRVALARTLATRPEVLLLDEPMSALDAPGKVEMRQYLGSVFRSFDGPVVLVTHDPIDAFGLADRVLVMEQGRLVQTGRPDDLRLRPATRYVADLVGTNLLEGVADSGIVATAKHEITIADGAAAGEVFVQIHPRSVVLHTENPSGSARNVWQSVVSHVESLGDVARVTFDEPVPLTAEVTRESVERLALTPGAQLYVAIKATEVEVRPR